MSTCEERGCNAQAVWSDPDLEGRGVEQPLAYLLRCDRHVKSRRATRVDGQFNGGRIRQARAMRGLSREDLAELLGITEWDMWLMEERGTPIPDVVAGKLALSNVLNVEVGFYLRRDPEPVPPGSLVWHSPPGAFCSVCCARTTEALCDYPLGRGKTCDAPLCGGCRWRLGPGMDVDYCPAHAQLQPHIFEGGKQ